MNVFILNTGRCGSTTIIKACRHLTNYSAAHESRTWMLGDEHFAYPENHIEADNRLSWLLGRLDKAFGDNAFYVHLKRDDTETARSYAQRREYGIMKAYSGLGILMGVSEETPPEAIAKDCCYTVNSNIELFLKDKTHKMEMHLETIKDDFTQLWEAIGAEGNLQAALEEFDKHHNATVVPLPPKKAPLPIRGIRKLTRLVTGIPGYIRNT